MASGRHHDRATGLLALPFALLWWPALGPLGSAIAGAAFLLGGLWLSPDLDLPSRATRRWGPLGVLWWPYRRLLRHRSLLSHSPLLGSGVRLGWLAALLWLGAHGLRPLGLGSPQHLLEAGRWLWSEQRPLLLAALVGVEASSWLHLLQDGDPLPRVPRLIRWLRRPGGRRTRQHRWIQRRRQRMGRAGGGRHRRPCGRG